MSNEIKESTIKLDFWAKLLAVIAGILGLAIYMINRDQKVITILFIGLFFGLILMLLSIYIVRKYYLPKGVFAVSAIIINDKMNLLLIKENRNGKVLYKQPGGHYRTNKLIRNNLIYTPYSKLIKDIEEKTGIDSSNLDFVDLSEFQNKKEEKLGNLIPVKDKGKYQGYEKNEISPPPFLIMNEKSETPKSSGEFFHIDMFYAFRLSNNNVSIEKPNVKLEFKSKDDIYNLAARKEVHSDLVYVFDNFEKIYKTTNYPDPNIRMCTFDTSKEKNILLWRITQNCNANCEYCLVNCPKKNKTIFISNNTVQTVIKDMKISRIKKLIISGGEPLLIDNIYDIIKKVTIEVPTCESVTVCTNGIRFKEIEYYNKNILPLRNIPKFSKFVVSVDHYDESTYLNLKKAKSGFRLSDLIDSLNKLREDNFEVAINVMATDEFLSSPSEYLNFWKENRFKRVSISYPIKCGNAKKFEIKTIYDKIISGFFGDISFLEKNCLELIIPDCDYEHCPNSNGKIFHVDSNGRLLKKCIEKS